MHAAQHIMQQPQRLLGLTAQQATCMQCPQHKDGATQAAADSPGAARQIVMQTLLHLTAGRHHYSLRQDGTREWRVQTPLACPWADTHKCRTGTRPCTEGKSSIAAHAKHAKARLE